MKKFLSALAVALVVTFSANICAAIITYRYGDDPNCSFATTNHKGCMVYLYLPSVDVQEYNPPHYQISGRFYFTDCGDDIYPLASPSTIIALRYNWYTKEIFAEYEPGYWRLVERYYPLEKHYPLLSRRMKTDNIPMNFNLDNVKEMANTLFRAAYGINFYGY